MSFDLLAPHYRWMERVLAGEKLQRCRTAYLPEVSHSARVLLAGEGHGRFLSAFLDANATAEALVVDSSAGMLKAARQQLNARSTRDRRRVEFLHADAREWTPDPGAFDLIVTNFFFDCFPPRDLQSVARRLAGGAAPTAQWIVCDFSASAPGLRGIRARAIVTLMYWFFRVVTKLPARSITPFEPMLESSGFRLSARQVSEWGLLHADLWRRNEV